MIRHALAQVLVPALAVAVAVPVATVAVTASGAGCGGHARGPAHGWQDAPAPTPEEDIATAVLTELAGRAVAGFEPIGPPVGGDVKEGGLLSQRVEWQVGRCYAAVAGAFGGIEELELWIVASGPRTWPGAVVATDARRGNLAIAGAREACFTATDALPTGALVIRAARGGGFAAVQLYARAAP